MVAMRRALAAVLLLLGTAMWGYALGWETGWGFLCAAVFAAGDLLAATGIALRWFWARWLGLGIGLVGMLNIATWIALRGVDTQWFMLAQTAAFPLLFLLLWGRPMRAAFDHSPSPWNPWRQASPGDGVLRVAMVCNIATAPMMLSYGCIEGLTTQTRAFAIATAALLALAVVLVGLRRSAGVLLMAVAGGATVVIGLGALPTLLSPCTDPMRALWLSTALTAFPPAVLGALATLGVFARPMVRFLRAR
jgi:hypothetical protein